MLRCPACKAEFSYGRFICHNCEENSIYFGKIFKNKQKVYKWNCNTAKISMELMKRELKSIDSIIEKIPKIDLKENEQYEWNCDYTKRINNIQISERRSNFFHIYE